MRLLKSNCFSCHNEEKTKGGLKLTSREDLLTGGDSGAGAVPGKPDESAIIASLAADADPHMPPKKQLKPAQIDVLKRWVASGMEWNAKALTEKKPAARKVQLEAGPKSFRPVLAMALSPDGNLVAAGSGNDLVIARSGEKELTEVARNNAHLDAIQSIAWSADGKKVATGAYRRLTIWNTEPLAVDQQIELGFTDRISGIRFIDGDRVAVADGAVGAEGVIKMVDLANKKVTATWKAHRDTIFDLAVSPDGKLLATAGGDKLVKLWDIAAGREVAKLEGHALQVLAVAFDPTGEQLVSAGVDQQIKVWNVKTKERVGILGKHNAAITSLAWTTTKTPAVLAVSDAGGAFSYSELQSHDGSQRSNSGKEKRFDAADVALNRVVVRPDGERSFAGTQDGRIISWNKDGKIAATLRLNAEEKVNAQGPTFLRDVLPILTKAGCSAGACHAKPDGQNGFRQTVFSFDPQSDYREIVQEARGRRIFPAAPGESLILLKATEAVPHEGGQRFDRDSDAYKTLVQWIRSGMPYRGENEPNLERLLVEPSGKIYPKGAQQRLKVTARYTDGSTRDVTDLAEYASNDKEIAKVTDDGLITVGKVPGQAVVVARFMGLVADSRIDIPSDRRLPAEKYAALRANNFIDQHAYAQFKSLGLYPSDPCTDEEFIRRATLDTIGILPTPEEARAFIADKSPDKRAKLIDRLLDHPLYADYWANKWADLLRPNTARAGIKSVYILDQWIRDSFRANKPYDQFVREIVLAEGNTHRYGPAVIYRDRRDPAEITTMFSQLFLGVRLDCAKCHHHPNEKWGQEDFYQMAAFFGPVKQKGAGISAPISAGNETFYFNPGKNVKHPVTGELLDPKAPDGPVVKVEGDSDPRFALADWMTNPENPFFAPAVANRVWAAFFGRGIVDPVDDFRISNPPSNPALLDAIARELVQKKYDLKGLMRSILNSQLYQLSSIPNEFNTADTRNFSRSYRRRMPAEVLADAVADVTGVATSYAGMPPESRAIQAWTYKIDSATMDAFGRPNSSSDCPCERDVRPSIVQALHLMNSTQLQDKLVSKDKGARVERLANSSLTPEQIVQDLYLTCYSRFPTDEELKVATAAFSIEGATRRTATEDVLWSLLNSAEFIFNH